MAIARRSYSGEYKIKAIQLVTQKGLTYRKAGLKLGIRESMLRIWQAKWTKGGDDAFPENAKLPTRDASMAKEIEENRRLRKENRNPKKSEGLSRKPYKLRFRFIKTHSDIWPVRLMCKVLLVSNAGFYQWLKRPESDRSRRQKVLLEQIREIHEQSQKQYGRRRVHKGLLDLGIKVSLRTVGELMSKHGIKQKC